MNNPTKLIGLVVLVFAVLVGGAWWSSTLADKNPDVLARDGLHWHPQLRIFINGEEQEISANIGLVGGHKPIHTHEDLPNLHLEFGGVVSREDVRLGNFFETWGREFNESQIFDHRNGSEGTVHMFVNGEENFEFENYQMRDGDRIEIRYE